MEAISLPKMFRLIGTDEIPPSVFETGYDPNIGPQVVLRASQEELQEWRTQNNLSEVDYPIQPSDLVGDHIDIYGDDVARFFPDNSLVTSMTDFMRRSRKTVQTKP